MVRLHLGCGDIRLEGFINIDVRHTSATDKVMDVSNLAEFDDSSVDLIYASHCLEHFSFRFTLDILCEWNRVLRKGGELILRVPDFDILVNTYLKRRSSEIPQLLRFCPGERYPRKILKIITYLLAGSKKEGFLCRVGKLVKWLLIPERRTLTMNLLGDFLGGQDYPENYHKAFFNEKFLRELLCKAGFGEIKRYCPRLCVKLLAIKLLRAYPPK